MHSEIELLAYKAVGLWAQAQGLVYRFYGDERDSNRDTETKTDHLRIGLMPTKPDDIDLCQGARFIWLLNIMVAVRDGAHDNATSQAGRVRAGQIRDQLITTFHRLYAFTGGGHNYRVIDTPEPMPPLPSRSGWYEQPVEFRIEAIT